MTERAVLSIDGDHACALLGPNLQEGEAEFHPIENWPAATPKQEHAAMLLALAKLEARIGRTLPYRVSRDGI